MIGQNNNSYNTSNYFGALTPQPQPSGMVYQVHNTMEVNNIPVGAGIIAAINMQENLLYLKSANNGVAAYKLTPYVEPVKTNETASLEQRLTSMEQQLSALLAALNKNEPKAAKEQPIPWDA